MSSGHSTRNAREYGQGIQGEGQKWSVSKKITKDGGAAQSNIFTQQLTMGRAVTRNIKVDSMSSISVVIQLEQCTGENSCFQPSKNNKDITKGPGKVLTTQQRADRHCQKTTSQPIRCSKGTASIQSKKFGRAAIKPLGKKTHENKPESSTPESTTMHARREPSVKQGAAHK